MNRTHNRRQCLVAWAAAALAVSGCSEKPQALTWTPVASADSLGNLSTALWAPNPVIRRGSLAYFFIFIKNHSSRDVVIPKDVFGYFGLQADFDGARQAPSPFDYSSGERHDWTLKPGDLLVRQIPVFTGNACDRLKDLETIHPLPLPVEPVLVGIYAEHATNLTVRLGLPASTNRLEAKGISEIRFVVTE